jgi:hypothetical protein
MTLSLWGKSTSASLDRWRPWVAANGTVSLRLGHANGYGFVRNRAV